MKRLLLLLCLIHFVASAQEPSKQSKKSVTQVADSIRLTSRQMKELDYYKRLYELADKQAQTAHADMLWSLAWEAGILLGVIAILAGAQVFWNFSIAKGRLESIGERIHQNLLSEQREATAGLTRQLNLFREEMSAIRSGNNNQITTLNAESLEALKKQAKIAEQRLESKINYHFQNSNTGHVGKAAVNENAVAYENLMIDKALELEDVSKRINEIILGLHADIEGRNSIGNKFDKLMEVLAKQDGVEGYIFDALEKLYLTIPPEFADKRKLLDSLHSLYRIELVRNMVRGNWVSMRKFF